MSFQIRPASEADVFRLGCIGRDAFRDTLSEALFPPHLRHKSETGDPGLDEAQWRAARTLQRLRDGKPTFVVVEVHDDENKQEEVLGFAQWEAPLHSPPAQEQSREADAVVLPSCLDQGNLRKLYETLVRETKQALGPEGYSKMWFLMILAIDPAHQRRGIGRMLVEHGLDMAAKAGTDAFLLATPAGQGLYRSLGFQALGAPIDVLGIRHYAMLWKLEDQARR